MQNVAVVGSSGHARVVIDIISQLPDICLIGLLDDFRRCGDATDGVAVLGAVSDLPDLISAHHIDSVVVAIGDNWLRRCLVEKIVAMEKKIEFPKIVHPKAYVANNVVIEEGVVIGVNAVVNVGCAVKSHCIINTAASLDHDGVMEEYSSLAPGVNVGGNAHIGRFAAICIGAKISHKIRIGVNSVVGAGGVVVRDIPDGCLAMGVPARVVRHRQLGEKYL